MKEIISPIILDRVPDFIKEDYPKMVSFLQEYFEWLEEPDNCLRVLLDFKTDRDVSSNSESYINETLKQLGFTIPKNLTIDKSHLIYFLRSFYLAQGSLDSFKFLFKLFFNVDVEIRYPRTKLAICSNSILGSFTKIYTTASNSDQPKFNAIVNNKETYFSTSIRGLQTNVITNIEDIVPFEMNGEKYLQISIIPPDEKYLIDEAVEFKYGDITFSEQIVPVGQVEIFNPGINYSVGDMVTAYTDTSHQVLKGRYLVSRIQRGSIDAVGIASAGIGYEVGDMIFTEYVPTGAGFSAEVSSVSITGEILNVRILNAGWRYNRLPNLTITTKSGSGGSITSSSTTIGRILQLNPVHSIVYKLPATVTTEILSSDGSGAVLVVVPVDTYTEIRRNLNPVNGILGRDCILTDSNLFQQFSYEVVSNIPLNMHSHISDTVHPVGYTRFNIYQIQTSEAFSFTAHSVIDPTKVYKLYDTLGFSLSLSDWEWLRLVNVISYGTMSLRQISLSINILDEHKFSDTFDYLPMDYPYPVVDSLLSNSFLSEAMDAEIRIT